MKSEDEQDVLLDTFQHFLNSLSCPLQILIRVREIDVERYIERIEEYKKQEKDEVYRKQNECYTDFIRQVVTGNKILTRKFYLIIPFESNESDFSLIKEQLFLLRDLIQKGIEKLGMKAHMLPTSEVLTLFYSFYNQDQLQFREVSSSLFSKQLKGSSSH